MKIGYYRVHDSENRVVPVPEVSDDPNAPRLVILFSCGITSFFAAFYALYENARRWGLPVRVIYTYVREEPLDNLRFLRDAQQMLGEPILILKNEDYDGSIYRVFEETGWLVGPGGARCTTELKWRVRKEFTRDEDIQVFGFNAGEEERLDNFAEANPGVEISCPLICLRLDKQTCINLGSVLGLRLPESYRRGYVNANCVGCVKGQQGYWNHVRQDAPEVFKRMASVERKMGVAINKSYAGDGKRKKVFLDELPPEAGRYDSLELPDCGVLCELEQGLK